MVEPGVEVAGAMPWKSCVLLVGHSGWCTAGSAARATWAQMYQ